MTQNFLTVSPSYGYKKEHKQHTFTKSIRCNNSRMNKNKQPKKYSDRCKNFFVKENDPQGKIYQTYKEGK